MPASTLTRSARLRLAHGASLFGFGLSIALLWPPRLSATTPTPLMSCCGGSACCGPVGLPCQLSYGVEGTVVDARTGAPIAGARITVAGDLTTTSNSDGSFGAFGSRPETCNLDYYVPIVVEARGYAPFSDALYTSVPLRHLDVRLEPLGTGTGFMVSGVVAEYPPCESGMDGVTVVLAPLGRRTQTGSSGPGYPSGFFAFADVPPGTYTLSVEPRCNLYGCWDPQPVTVANLDVGLAFCPHVQDDVVRLGAGRATGAPGSAVDIDFSLHTAGADVAHVASTIGFEPEARIAAAADGTPDCEVVAAAEAAAFSWVPAGCAPGDCVAVRSEVQIGGTPPQDDAALFRCRIAITDQPADSCYHVLRCVDLEVSDRNGVSLEAMCENGSVTSETPRAGLGFSFSVTPKHPVADD
jgi:hypothetical protein